ncbi:Tagatose-6-phosphate kinase AgaZ [Acidisarcina polymorpha]|uniref:Tagatose-6-phosphate kinase AgaZ n=1 Tax=Acidisarcina polymorpha TaxID=2211140 RepID=A0A2Z5G1F2_9BACT|nr:D-tagatose-bisphosphate aldolase, class II, non-catalytic subunit [Acidisarcina polymorpha]AXC12634.1 Tagatose-6-phosphate kinase AgaZ [Acidisarcina polymorpha]
MSTELRQLLAERKKPHKWRGIYSVCSAHPYVLRAAMKLAKTKGSPLLIEATSNQVNQFGGYTGMQPTGFVDFVHRLAGQEDFPQGKLILGGDHLGPNPWASQPTAEAMDQAEVMVSAYAAAGFTKIHLDASMPCAGDLTPLPDAVIARRAARLCLAAEKAAGGREPLYIIGTEVPTPGGALEDLGHLKVTTREAALQTLQVHRQIFAESGLEHVWPRVVGMVVQPGVEFNHDSVVFYDPKKAAPLVEWLSDQVGHMVFEAHSTDYQTPAAYENLVRDGFAILKVGPALTFAMREALFALAAIEAELHPSAITLYLPDIVEKAMLRSPGAWQSHYLGSEDEVRLLRRFSYSDRLRYYWADPAIEQAVEALMARLVEQTLPETLISAYLPEQYRRLRLNLFSVTPEALVLDRIVQVLEPYAAACAPVA